MRRLFEHVARPDPASGLRGGGQQTPSDRWQRLRLYAALGVAVSCALLILAALYAVHVEPYWIKYHDVEIKIAGLPEVFDGFTIAHVADIHCGKLFPPERVREMISRVRERRPDAVAITGDLVQERAAYEGAFDEIDRIAREIPTYVVPGNHDYWQGIDLYRKLIAESAAIDLTNTCRIVKRGEARLMIAGVDDLTDGSPDLGEALAGLEADKAVVILLTHNPDFFPEVLAAAPGVDLVLAGHTHGGQVWIPFLGPPVLPVSHQEYAAGLVRGGVTRMYVSRGVGMLTRLRFNCRPEVPFVVLRRK